MWRDIINLKDIYNEVSRLNGINVYDLIENLDLYVIENPDFENSKSYSSILFDQKIIFIQPDLEEEFKHSYYGMKLVTIYYIIMKGLVLTFTCLDLRARLKWKLIHLHSSQ
ncbi:hypothetical protein SDC9_158196 [bioreactor metagenome]|uniref:Uncharacterized protein n=1 Tax=bioreactor metagenome TaxID=1076179 RepID=A0A645FC32_9ZZZZ